MRNLEFTNPKLLNSSVSSRLWIFEKEWNCAFLCIFASAIPGGWTDTPAPEKTDPSGLFRCLDSTANSYSSTFVPSLGSTEPKHSPTASGSRSRRVLGHASTFHWEYQLKVRWASPAKSQQLETPRPPREKGTTNLQNQYGVIYRRRIRMQTC